MLVPHPSPSEQVLCADKRFEDFFGMDPGALCGQPFSTLSTDMEGIDR